MDVQESAHKEVNLSLIQEAQKKRQMKQVINTFSLEISQTKLDVPSRNFAPLLCSVPKLIASLLVFEQFASCQVLFEF